MIGAATGDYIGSVYEFYNIKQKEFPIIKVSSKNKIVLNRFTDDSVLTMAVAEIVELYLEGKYKGYKTVVSKLQEWARARPKAGYGGMFRKWVMMNDPHPYSSFGNGALMRISPVGLCSKLTLQEKIRLAKEITEVTHNHPQALQCVELYIRLLDECMSYRDKSEEEQKAFKESLISRYHLIRIDEARPTYKFDVTCDGSLPVAIAAFAESADFEDCIRNAISVGGDSDTIAAIAGGLGEALYGSRTVINFLDNVRKDCGRRKCITDCMNEKDPQLVGNLIRLVIAFAS